MLIAPNAYAAQPLLGVQQMAAGFHHSCAVVNGGAQCWGYNLYGQLGNGATEPASNPVAVASLNTGVAAIAGGLYHTCAIVNGGAQCWGFNGAGELGIGTYSYDRVVAQPVIGLAANVAAIAVGDDHACVIVNGGVQCWGLNNYGQLGNGTNANRNVPSAIASLSSGVTAIAAGAFHTCAIVNGGAQCWGYNLDGGLGNGTTTSTMTPVSVTGLGSDVTAITAGYGYTCAIVNGGAQCWGENSYGELGNGTGASTAAPVAVTGLNMGVVALRASRDYACALVNTDSPHPVKCWGNNATGQLGNNSTNAGFTPVDVSFSPPLAANDSVAAIIAGGSHACALVVRSGVAKMECWGDNEFGELGVAGPPSQSPTPTTVTGLSTGVTAISVGSTALHNCAVVSGGAQCWGSDGGGELGVATYSATSVAQSVISANSGVTAIAAGFYHTCAIVNGAAQCFGSNADGELGDGTFTPSIAPVAVTGLSSGVTALAGGGGYIFSEYGHTCAIVNGAAKCWGENADGQLGNGTTNNSGIPVAVTGLNTGVTAIAVGGGYGFTRYSTSCAVVSNAAKCWGNNAYGQLGNGSMVNSLVPGLVTGLSAGVTGIAVGNSHACAIINGGAQCWGTNAYGQLGNGTLTDSAVPVAVTGLSSGVTAIVAGANHTCAIVNGGAQCWGYNLDGELGNGTTAPSTVAPVAVIGLGSGVTALTAGYNQTCALLTGGAEKCWGSDQYGQLGDHRFLTAGSPQTVVVGDDIFHDGFGN